MNILREYTLSYIKNNKTTSISIIAAAYISSVFLSLISGVFYNIWMDDARLARLQSGGTLHNSSMVFFVYLLVLIISCISFIMIIHNAFGVSMNARMHQLGILQSIGATPRQLRTALTKEALLLCLLPIVFGVVTGVGLCYAFMIFMSDTAEKVREYDLIFSYHPMILLISLLISVITVWFSARIPARKLSRLNPLAAIRYGGDVPAVKMKNFFLSSLFLGIEGELARRSLYFRKKAFRTTSFSLTLSFLAFSVFLNMEAISSISTKYTFFERYKDKWDLMITCPITDEKENTQLLSDLRSIPGVKECIRYRKTAATTLLVKEQFSSELNALGGLKKLKDTGIVETGGGFLVEVPVMILDKESFQKYCSTIHADPSLFKKPYRNGAILVNTIWDNLHSNRKNKKLIPFLKESIGMPMELTMKSNEKASSPAALTVTVAAVTNRMPDLREELPNFSLLLILQESSLLNIDKNSKSSVSIFNIQTDSDLTITTVEQKAKELFGYRKDYTLENRLDKEKSNRSIRKAYKIVIGGLAGLLACIGLANVCSNALGQIHQRKREFARYLSIGLSPAGLKKVLISEAVILGLKPILISLLINIPLVIYGLNAAYIPLKDFIRQMPIIPITLFTAFILLTIGTAYYFGGKSIYQSDLMKALTDDTML